MKTNSTQQTLNYFCAIILSLSVIAKLITLWQNPALLSSIDPIFGISYKLVTIGATTIEIAIARILISDTTQTNKTLCLLLLTSIFAIYRVGLWIGMYPKTCSCLGSGLDFWPWFKANKDTIATIFFIFLATATAAQIPLLRTTQTK